MSQCVDAGQCLSDCVPAGARSRYILISHEEPACSSVGAHAAESLSSGNLPSFSGQRQPSFFGPGPARVCVKHWGDYELFLKRLHMSTKAIGSGKSSVIFYQISKCFTFNPACPHPLLRSPSASRRQPRGEDRPVRSPPPPHHADLRLHLLAEFSAGVGRIKFLRLIVNQSLNN